MKHLYPFIFLALALLLLLTGCGDGQNKLVTEPVILPPPTVAQAEEEPVDDAPKPTKREPESTDTQGASPRQQAQPRPDVIRPQVASAEPEEQVVVEGSSKETWRWELGLSQFRRFASKDGPMVVIHISNALNPDSPDFELTRYVYSERGWTRLPGPLPDDIVLDCRVVTPGFGSIYADLPSLKGLDDHWVVAFPDKTMAVIDDLRAATAQQDTHLRVVLDGNGGRLSAHFEDADGIRVAESIIIHRNGG